MNKDLENSDSDCNSEVPSEDSSSEDIEPSHKEDSHFESEQSAESYNEKPIDEDSITKKKSYGKKGWLFLLFLIITIGAGGYFHSQKKGIDIPITLPSASKKSLPFTEMTPRPLATQSKTLPIESVPKIIEQTEEPSTLEKPISANEKTINLLRNEIRSLKTELTQNNSTPLPQNVQNVIPHISGRTVREKTVALTGKEGGGTEPEMEISLIPPQPFKTEPTFKQNQHQKSSPQRSKEVQAYLDFVEDTGNKLVWLIKEGWIRLQALIL